MESACSPHVCVGSPPPTFHSPKNLQVRLTGKPKLSICLRFCYLALYTLNSTILDFIQLWSSFGNNHYEHLWFYLLVLFNPQRRPGANMYSPQFLFSFVLNYNQRVHTMPLSCLLLRSEILIIKSRRAAERRKKKRPCTKCAIRQSSMTQLWVYSNEFGLPGHVILFTEAPLDVENHRHPHCVPENPDVHTITHHNSRPWLLCYLSQQFSCVCAQGPRYVSRCVW